MLCFIHLVPNSSYLVALLYFLKTNIVQISHYCIFFWQIILFDTTRIDKRALSSTKCLFLFFYVTAQKLLIRCVDKTINKTLSPSGGSWRNCRRDILNVKICYTKQEKISRTCVIRVFLTAPCSVTAPWLPSSRWTRSQLRSKEPSGKASTARRPLNTSQSQPY